MTGVDRLTCLLISSNGVSPKDALSSGIQPFPAIAPLPKILPPGSSLPPIICISGYKPATLPEIKRIARLPAQLVLVTPTDGSHAKGRC